MHTALWRKVFPSIPHCEIAPAVYLSRAEFPHDRWLRLISRRGSIHRTVKLAWVNYKGKNWRRFCLGWLSWTNTRRVWKDRRRFSFSHSFNWRRGHCKTAPQVRRLSGFAVLCLKNSFLWWSSKWSFNRWNLLFRWRALHCCCSTWRRCAPCKHTSPVGIQPRTPGKGTICCPTRNHWPLHWLLYRCCSRAWTRCDAGWTTSL